MTIEFVCGSCGRELKADERSIGRRARCPECGTLMMIPAPEPAEEEPIELEPIEPQPISPTASVPPAPLPPTPSPQPPALSQPPFTEPPVDSPTTDELPVAPPPIAPPKRKKRPRVSPAPTEAHQPTPYEIAEEAPLLAPHPPHPEDLIDMTAMVDIVFFLLIFFLVTSLQALESVMNLPTPQAAEGGVATGRSAAELENDPNYISVRIEDDDSIWVEDQQVFNDLDLVSRLRNLRQESDKPRSLLCLGSADASHGAAVRVFDAAAGAGLGGISLVVQEDQGK